MTDPSRSRTRKGYKRFSDSGIPVHRYVAERKLGRKLEKGEVVHHMNRDKTDNRRDNLRVFRSQKKHDSAQERQETVWQMVKVPSATILPGTPYPIRSCAYGCERAIRA